MPYAANRLAVPRPTIQKSVSGKWFHNVLRYVISSSSAMRTPSSSGGIFLATMSIATLQRNMFVPMPAVAVMPVCFSTSRMMVIVSSWAVFL